MMKRLGFLLAALLLSQAVAAADDSWTHCQVDADCVVVGSVCPNFYWAIHRDYVFENAARNAADRDRIDCVPSFQSRPRRATCQKGQCQLPLNQPVPMQTPAKD